MYNKIIIILISCLFITNAYAAIDNSVITFTNNTDEPVHVHTNLITTDTAFVKGTNWDDVEDTLDPYETRQVLWFGRNLGLKNGIDYQYDFIVTRENDKTDQLDFRFHVTGSRFYGSLMTNNMQLPQQNTQDVLNKYGLEHYDSKFWNTDYTVHTRRWKQGTSLFSNMHIVIEKKDIQPTHQHSDNTFDILTYNTQLQPFYGNAVNDLNQPAERVKSIVPAIKNYDVVIFEELFDFGLRTALTKDMSADYPYHTQVVGSATTQPWTGGVMIFSKWPIDKEDQIVYLATTGGDQYAAKGVGYARVNKNGHYYNVFGTHLEAGDTVDDVRIRRKQIAEMETFINRLALKNEEPVLIGGDFNIDEFSLEAITLYTLLNADKLANSGYQYSCDGLVNTMNVDPARQRLDYVFYDKRYLMPKSAYNRVFVLRALSNEKMWPKFDLSDHFPVESHFEF